MTAGAMLAIFAVAAALMYLRYLPALLAVPAMAIGFALVAGAGASGTASVLVDGSARLAPVIATVVFGALLSRVTIATGIAETIVAYAAEFGGDRPVVLALALCAAVAVLFVSLTGLGAIIMIGSIVLPIMLTIGIPRRTAAALFMLAFALGFIFNVAQWTFYTKAFGVERAALQQYAFVLAAIDLVALVAYTVVSFRSAKGSAAWAVAAAEPLARRRAPPWSLIAPALPIVLYGACHIDAVVAFAISALYGVLTTRPRSAIETLVASAIRGVEDVAPAILLFMGIGMLLTAATLPAVKAALVPLVSAIAPHSAIAYVLVFGVLSPLALYRGPLNLFGVGIAVYTVLATLGTMPAVVLVAAAMAVVQVQNVCDPTNTQNVWVANFTGIRVDDITKATLPFQIGVAIAATIAVGFFGQRLVGVPAFASAFGSRAAAADAYPGLLAPAAAAKVVAVVAAPGADSAAAAEEIERQIGRGWPGFSVVTYEGDPAASDCAAKAFVAVLSIEATAHDAGVTLTDCAGWPVDQWFVPRSDDVRADALSALVRLRTWTIENPALATSLFAGGLAYDARHAKPTYLYSLFKTTDGQMRAYVRPGGPAYVAGLRTNDIVSKLDGKFWWEYGTFQTQSRAYDGRPHEYVVTRDGQELTVRLGEPLRTLPQPS